MGIKRIVTFLGMFERCESSVISRFVMVTNGWNMFHITSEMNGATCVVSKLSNVCNSKFSFTYREIKQGELQCMPTEQRPVELLQATFSST